MSGQYLTYTAKHQVSVPCYKTVKLAEQRIEGLKVKRITSGRLSGVRNTNDCRSRPWYGHNGRHVVPGPQRVWGIPGTIPFPGKGVGTLRDPHRPS